MFSLFGFNLCFLFSIFSLFFTGWHAWGYQGGVGKAELARDGWQGTVGKAGVGKAVLARRGWQGGVGKERLARGGGGLALEGKELRLGDNSSKGRFAIQFANPKIADQQRIFRYPKKINQHSERKNIDKHRSKRQVGERLAKCWKQISNQTLY